MLEHRIPPRRRLPARPARFALAAATAATAALSLMLTAAPASAAVNYVALGDSYASGLGAGNYSGGSCDRSANAYPQVWANANHPASFAFVACSGATTTDVISNQISALSTATTLVSVTIGGNDVGFSNVMITCVLGSTSDCVNAVNQAEAQARSQLPGALSTLFGDIKARAPNARVVVIGYPEFYDLSRSSGCIGLSTTDRTALDGGADLLDSVISTAAGQAGFAYAEVRSGFTGHEICDSSSWLHSVDWLNLGDSYHPTASGQSGGYYPVFSAAA
ncbi:MAG TPA: SGNH/GDSL hydrolase family protein [Streptosporangiaceae bacterium]|nr:SGNH/GDSL hydrolase family protein [Streptosporangiaceae bacterium]